MRIYPDLTLKLNVQIITGMCLEKDSNLVSVDLVIEVLRPLSKGAFKRAIVQRIMLCKA